jgi:hypothetical protein
MHHREIGFNRRLQIIHPTDADYTFFSSAQGTFSKIYHILGYKASIKNRRELKLFLVAYDNGIK